MTANTFGDNFRVTTFGESHGLALGVVVDGLRPGLPVDAEAIQAELDRRRPGQNRLVTPRKEADRLQIVSGVFEGKTTGHPICALVWNTDAKPGHYEAIKDLFRPGHADYTFYAKYGIRDWRGGGRSSGRETVARVAAGAIARQMLTEFGVEIVGHVVQVGPVRAPAQTPDVLDATAIEASPVRCALPEVGEQMAEAIEAARKAGDSVGGVVEVVARGVPAGWGDPVFRKLDAQLAAALMSIGAVKAVEIGDGFAVAGMPGSQANDPIRPAGFASNRAGGVLGGISNGEPIVARLAVKPTSSIRHEQQTATVDGEAATLQVKGRHDPCIALRAVPVAEAMVALVLADAALRQQAMTEADNSREQRTAELAWTDSEIVRLLHRRLQVGGRDEAALATAREEMAQALGLDTVAVARVFDAVAQVPAPSESTVPEGNTQ